MDGVWRSNLSHTVGVQNAFLWLRLLCILILSHTLGESRDVSNKMLMSLTLFFQFAL